MFQGEKMTFIAIDKITDENEWLFSSIQSKISAAKSNDDRFKIV